MTSEPGPRPVLHLVACAAPPIQRIDELIRLLQDRGWTVCLIPTPTAAEWIDVDALAGLTGQPVRARNRRPGEAKFPAATAVAAVPATFNTINKWAAGINDNAALGVLNEAVGLALPVVIAPYAKSTLAAHPAFSRSCDALANCGFTVLPPNAVASNGDSATYTWNPILDALLPITPR